MSVASTASTEASRTTAGACSVLAHASEATLGRLLPAGTTDPVSVPISPRAEVSGDCTSFFVRWGEWDQAVNASVDCSGAYLSVWSIHTAAFSVTHAAWVNLTGSVPSERCPNGTLTVILSLYVDLSVGGLSINATDVPGVDLSIPSAVLPEALNAAVDIVTLVTSEGSQCSANPMGVVSKRMDYRAFSPLSVLWSPLGMVLGGVVVVVAVILAQLVAALILYDGDDWMEGVFMPGMGLHAAGATLWGVGVGGGMLVLEGGLLAIVGWLASAWVCVGYPLTLLALIRPAVPQIRFVASPPARLLRCSALEEPLDGAVAVSTEADATCWSLLLPTGYMEPRRMRRMYGGVIGDYRLPTSPSMWGVVSPPLLCMWATPCALTILTLVGPWLGCTGTFLSCALVEAVVVGYLFTRRPGRYPFVNICRLAMHLVAAAYFTVAVAGFSSRNGEPSESALDAFAYMVSCMLGVRLVMGATCMVVGRGVVAQPTFENESSSSSSIP